MVPSAQQVVLVAPAPVLAGLDAAHDGVPGRFEMPGGVGGGGGIAAPHVAALQAHAEVNRRRSLPDAVLAERTAGHFPGCRGFQVVKSLLIN